MRLRSLILLFLFTVGLRAGEEAVPAATPAPVVAPATSNAPATSSAPAPAATTVEAAKPAEKTADAVKPAEPTPTYTTYRLSNKLVEVEVIDRQGAIRQLSLLQTHPVRLHAWQAKAQLGKGHTVPDPAKPLPALSAFNPGGSYHNWLTGIGLSDKALWTKISGDDSHLVLSHENAEMRWTLRYDLPADSLALRSTLTVENLGKADVSFRPVIYPLNGVHQDDVSQDAAYLALVHHNRGASGKMTSLYLPPLPTPGYPATATVIPVEQLDYVSVKSRFFGALWHPLGHAVRDTVSATTPVPAPTTTPVVEGGPGAVGGGPQAGIVVGPASLMRVQSCLLYTSPSPRD